MPTREADDIQSLRVGVDTLRILNTRPSISTGELSAELGLSRAAAYRVLKTLSTMGYVIDIPYRRGTRYRATVLVRGLSDGFDGDVRLLATAQPLMLASTSVHGWPLALVTPVGDRCIVRFNTDHATSRVIRRYRAGGYASMLYSAAGILCLGSLPDTTQKSVLRAQLSAVPPPYGKTLSEEEFMQDMARAKSQGYATFEPVGERESSVAVPLTLKNVLVGALTLRYMRIAAGGSEGLDKKLATLRDLAATIERQLGDEIRNSVPACNGQ